MSSSVQNLKRLTLRDLQSTYLKKEKLSMLTAYDVVTAGILDEAGIEMLLVGDSLGNVILGHETTLPVTLEDMIRHTSAVVRGTQRALIICDLPFGTATDPETALRASIKVLQKTGCQAVKLEGGLHCASIVKKLTEQGIPVMGHIGLVPQSIHQLGGYYQHGKTESSAQYLLESALTLQSAGAFSIVLECITHEIASGITRKLNIPTIGIGSGSDCSGQVLVINDLVGLSLKPPPKFAKPRADVASVIRKAAREYLNEIKTTSEDHRPETKEEECLAGLS